MLLAGAARYAGHEIRKHPLGTHTLGALLPEVANLWRVGSNGARTALHPLLPRSTNPTLHKKGRSMNRSARSTREGKAGASGPVGETSPPAGPGTVSNGPACSRS